MMNNSDIHTNDNVIYVVFTAKNMSVQDAGELFRHILSFVTVAAALMGNVMKK